MTNQYKAQMPDLMEAVFDAAYLIFDLIAGVLFFAFSHGNILYILYGILTLTLCGGDAFHLVPRIIRAVHGSSEKIKRQLGIGLQVSSVTMTVSVHLEVHLPRAFRSCCRRSNDLDLGHRPDRNLPAAAEQLVL